jgi:lysosomal Pro-X carboxypeptidase
MSCSDACLQARHSVDEKEHTTRTYRQRYFVCDEYWKPGGPIFFYLGNEADVLLCAAVHTWGAACCAQLCHSTQRCLCELLPSRAVLCAAATLSYLLPPPRYLNNSGFQWETAAQMNALLVFAEHRYYGKSKPFPGEETWQNMQYLSTDQALVRAQPDMGQRC